MPSSHPLVDSAMSVNEGEKPVADKKFEVLDGSSETSRTYIFGDEDHTLGNSLRHVLMQRRVLSNVCLSPRKNADRAPSAQR